MAAEATVGIIGGSGLYRMDGLSDARELELDTPFGSPSDSVIVGSLEGVKVAFLPRHGKGHRIMPTHMPAQANIYALKSLGVEMIISVSAVGSLKEELKPLDIVIPDQLIDRTRQRSSTFFGDGIVAHVGFADPFCPVLSGVLDRSAQAVGATVHRGGACVVMEGPAFSTRAESFMYRSWGADIIGMTALPEAKLAREAEICYATLACITDYDCWHESEEDVTVEMVVANLSKNVATSKDILRSILSDIPDRRDCLCSDALKDSIITSPDRVTSEIKERLHLIIGKYLS